MKNRTHKEHTPTVILAERNSRIRRFLEREFRSEGYCVVSVGDGRELRKAAQSTAEPDVFVIDIEVPYLEEGLLDSHGNLALHPLIVHALMPEAAHLVVLAQAEAVVEKKADPSSLKQTVARLLACDDAQSSSSSSESEKCSPFPLSQEPKYES